MDDEFLHDRVGLARSAAPSDWKLWKSGLCQVVEPKHFVCRRANESVHENVRIQPSPPQIGSSYRREMYSFSSTTFPCMVRGQTFYVYTTYVLDKDPISSSLALGTMTLLRLAHLRTHSPSHWLHWTRVAQTQLPRGK
jgi:hypothetical protein